MKANEIMCALKLLNNTYNKAHCSQLAEIFKLLSSEKKNIVSVETTPETVMFGKTVNISFDNYQEKRTVKNEGTKLAATKFTIKTARAEYNVCVPVDNDFHTAVCHLLGVEVAPKPCIEVKETISLPVEVLGSLKKAAKFVGKDALRPSMMHVLIEIEKGTASIISTNAHFLYMSQGYKVATKKKLSFLIPGDKIKNIPAGERCDIAIINDNVIAINGYELALLTYDTFPNYKVVVPAYTCGVSFDKYELSAKIKEVLPHANKSTSLVDFTFNGAMYLHTQDVDFSTEATRKMAYSTKDIPDFSTAFNGKFLLNVLAAFDTKQVNMLHCGEATKAAIFTDGIDKILLMPLARLEGVEYVPKEDEVKALPAPVPASEEKEAEPVKVAKATKEHKEPKQPRRKNVEKIDGLKVKEPVELGEMGSIITVSIRWASQARKLNRILKCSYRYNKDARRYDISDVTKTDIEKLLVENGINIK